LYGCRAVGRNSEVFVANADGSGEVNVSKSPAFDGWPLWSPDGKLIVFSSNRQARRTSARSTS
jgi:TolB protein